MSKRTFTPKYSEDVLHKQAIYKNNVLPAGTVGKLVFGWIINGGGVVRPPALHGFLS